VETEFSVFSGSTSRSWSHATRLRIWLSSDPDYEADSDVDILVDVDPKIGLRFVELGDEIEKLLGTKVDLVSQRALKISHLELIKSDLVHV
jgi:predicted nucleotidyltransferase